MASLPTENALASAIGIVREGFNYIYNRRRKFNSDIFQINAFGLKAFAFGGEEAAEAFYDPEKFVRKGVVPITVQKSLTGVKAIHTTDGSEHRDRKAMFMSLMTDESISHLNALIRQELESSLPTWKQKDFLVLFVEAAEIFCKAICKWSGVPIKDEEVAERTDDLVSMVDGFGSMGLRNWRGIRARNRSEQWIKGIIKEVREGKSRASESTALYATAFYKDQSGKPFDLHLAAVELLNIIRPTVAISWYVTFAATALHQYTEARLKFFKNENNYRDLFIEEVRRFYPFAPFMGARVSRDFDWKGVHFPKNRMVLLDMYGTNHDPRLWEQPENFLPERFLNRDIRPYDFLAQGGGYHHNGHRCPGEWITVESLKTFLGFLVERLQFDIPEQDLSYDLSWMPTLPKSGFVIRNVKEKRSYD